MRLTPGLIPAFLLFSAANYALATTFMAQDFGDSVNSAPVLVHGTVGSSYADWSKAADGSRRIYTFYDLQITEVFKGPASGTSLVFREMGGEKDGVGMNVSGTAHFDRGEDVVVLLGDRNPDGSYDLRDMMMGKLLVKHDDSSGADVLSGPALSQQPGTLVHGDDDAGAKPKKQWTLDSLRQFIASRKSGQPSQQSSASANGAVATMSAAPDGGQAPRLQPAETEGSERSNHFVKGFLLALAALGVLAYFARRRTK
jgi:hypothetical protein